MPRNPVLGILYACLLGVILPICECGMIPIVRRLIRKGMPVYMGMTYILAAPIINPVTYAATAMAFRSDPSMAYYRIGITFVAVFIIGIILYFTVKQSPLKPLARDSHTHAHGHGHEHEHEHGHDHEHAAGRKISSIFTHAADEFFDMGKYLMLGAFLTACIQTFVSRSDLIAMSGGNFGSHLFMMAFAYVISLCSSSDAFIAASFAGSFPKSALLAFLVFGPMVDFKNTFMLLSAFKSRFVYAFIALISIVVLLLTVTLSSWL